MLKPSFSKSEKVGEGLCNLLIKKAEKSARGENAALMKKGLRQFCLFQILCSFRENAALMKKGLRLLHLFDILNLNCENAALMKKGLRRYLSGGYIFNAVKTQP